MKYGNLTLGQIEAGINKIGGEEAFRRLLRGELVVSEPTLSITVTSDGTTGKQWVKRLKKKGFLVSDYAKQLLLSSDFKPTKGVICEVVIIKGSFWKTDDARMTTNIRAEADKCKLETPNAEVACLLREALTDAQLEVMGLWWIAVMHEPIKDSDRDPGLLGVSRRAVGPCLDVDLGDPRNRWGVDIGFAFVVPKGT